MLKVSILLTALLVSLLQIAFGQSIVSANGNDVNPPELPWGDINILVVTDDHSWVAGHERKEPYLNVDYGELLSFFKTLKSISDQTPRDLFFVMNGDWIDGTALSLNGDISSLIPLIQKMPFDVVNTGNHELYTSNVIQAMRQPGGFIDWWGNRHLSSNIVMADNKEPLSHRFMVLEGKHSKVLVFGFIYHLMDPAAEVIVNDPADEVKESWFADALTQNQYDAILVMAHMGADDVSVAVILDGIRTVVGSAMPVQFVSGHTHLRRWAKIDDLSTAVEAGRYLDTVGFISFPKVSTVEMRSPASSMDLFKHAFMDANVNVMKFALGSDFGFGNPDGEELHSFIASTQKELGILDIVGCAPGNYFMNRSMTDGDSLWGLYRDQVVPSQLEQDPTVNRAIIICQCSWRYDLFEGSNAYDDVVAVSPFNDYVYFVGMMPCQAVSDLHNQLNKDATDLYFEMLPAYILAGTVVAGEDCELYTHQFDLSVIKDGIEKIHPGTYEVSATNLTSTSIWVDFFLDKWPCAGQMGLQIPWFDDHKIVDQNGNTNRKNLAIVIGAPVTSILVICCLSVSCWSAVKRVCFGQASMSEEEMDAFKDDREIEAEFA